MCGGGGYKIANVAKEGEPTYSVLLDKFCITFKN